jgi:hypothetical protein
VEYRLALYSIDYHSKKSLSGDQLYLPNKKITESCVSLYLAPMAELDHDN